MWSGLVKGEHLLKQNSCGLWKKSPPPHYTKRYFCTFPALKTKQLILIVELRSWSSVCICFFFTFISRFYFRWFSWLQTLYFFSSIFSPEHTSCFFCMSWVWVFFKFIYQTCLPSLPVMSLILPFSQLSGCCSCCCCCCWNRFLHFGWKLN